MPVKLHKWGLPLALSPMLTAALRDPVAVGVNVTLIPQTKDADKLPPQVKNCSLLLPHRSQRGFRPEGPRTTRRTQVSAATAFSA